MTKKNSQFPLGWLLFALLLLNGCSIGPKHLKDGHLAYNDAVRLSSDTELLLNIVRARYLDTIEFLSTNSISAQVSFSVAVGASAGTEFGETTAIALGEVAWSNRPTFTFTPQRGAEFAHKIMTPLPLPALAGLGGSDVAIGTLWRLMVVNVNGLTNVSGLTSEEFLEFAGLLDQMQARGDLYFGSVEQREALSDPIAAKQVSGSDLVEAAKAGYRFVHAPSAGQFVLTETRTQPVLYATSDAPERDRLFKLARLRPGNSDYVELQTGTQPDDKARVTEHLVVDTRSVLETIAYLAGGITPPSEHIAKGWVGKEWPIPEFRSGGLPNFFEVNWSKERPDVALAVPYRGYWFYVNDTDQETRLTFTLLAEIMRLALSPSDKGQQAPVLTLPIGGG